MSEKTGIACEGGEYKDFSGIIMWGGTEGVVENATFIIAECFGLKLIIFYLGTWVSGIWEYGSWKRGLWKDGVWENGIWEDGIWENGTWKDGEWNGGTWHDGTWKKGTWKRGVWGNGIWKTGYDRNECARIVSPNNWKN